MPVEVFSSTLFIECVHQCVEIYIHDALKIFPRAEALSFRFVFSSGRRWNSACSRYGLNTGWLNTSDRKLRNKLLCYQIELAQSDWHVFRELKIGLEGLRSHPSKNLPDTIETYSQVAGGNLLWRVYRNILPTIWQMSQSMSKRNFDCTWLLVIKTYCYS